MQNQGQDSCGQLFWAVKGITEWVRDDANRVGRKRLTHYIVAENFCKKTGTGELFSRFFCTLGKKRPQYPVSYQKDSRFFYVFLPPSAVVPGRKLCYNDRN